MSAEFQPVYADLRAMMLRAAPEMQPLKDAPGELQVQASWPNPRKPKEPMWFGMVKLGKAYVSYHLLPLYMIPAMQAKVGPALAKRKQGLACFNFKTAEPALFDELERLTAECAAAFAKPMTF